MPIALEFFVHYACGILFVWVLVEQMGVPVPSIPLLITAGTLMATHRVGAVPAVLSVLGACLIADTMWYLAGRRYGGKVLRLLCRLSLEASTCVKKTEGYFGKHGGRTLLLAKFVPGLSTVAAPIAGQTGMPLAKFLVLDAAGSLIWLGTYLAAGYFFGDVAKKSAVVFRFLGHFAVLLFVVAVLGFFFYRLYKQRAFLKSVSSMRLDNSELMGMIEAAAAGDAEAPFIVDLRHPLDYLPDPRVLPGALRVGPAELKQRVDMIPRDRDVILYCTCPSEETSAQVALELHKLGVYRVRPLRGGFDGWKKAGYPLVDYAEPSPVA